MVTGFAVSRFSRAPSFKTRRVLYGPVTISWPSLKPGEHFDVGGARDAGGDGNEFGAQLAVRVLVDDEDALLGSEPPALHCDGVDAASTLPVVPGGRGACMVSA